MSWRTQWYGSETPSRSRRWATYALMIFLLLTCYGMFSKFFPSDLALRNGLYVACACGISAVLWCLWVAHNRRNQLRSGWKGLLLVVPLLFAFTFVFSWLAFTQGAASLLTWSFGSSVVESARLHTVRSSRSRRCDHRLEGGLLSGNLLHSELCISEAFYLAHPDATVEVKLHGQRSRYGLRVSDISLPQ